MSLSITPPQEKKYTLPPLPESPRVSISSPNPNGSKDLDSNPKDLHPDPKNLHPVLKKKSSLNSLNELIYQQQKINLQQKNPPIVVKRPSVELRVRESLLELPIENSDQQNPKSDQQNPDFQRIQLDDKTVELVVTLVSSLETHKIGNSEQPIPLQLAEHIQTTEERRDLEECLLCLQEVRDFFKKEGKIFLFGGPPRTARCTNAALGTALFLSLVLAITVAAKGPNTLRAICGVGIIFLIIPIFFKTIFYVLYRIQSCCPSNSTVPGAVEGRLQYAHWEDKDWEGWNKYSRDKAILHFLCGLTFVCCVVCAALKFIFEMTSEISEDEVEKFSKMTPEQQENYLKRQREEIDRTKRIANFVDDQRYIRNYYANRR